MLKTERNSSERQENGPVFSLQLLTEAANGCVPFDIVYKVSVPSELTSETVVQIKDVLLKYEEQRFPECEIDKNIILSVKVDALCRRLQLAMLHCTCPRQSTSQDHCFISKAALRHDCCKETADYVCPALCMAAVSASLPSCSQRIEITPPGEAGGKSDVLLRADDRFGSLGDDWDDFDRTLMNNSFGFGEQSSLKCLCCDKEGCERVSVILSPAKLAPSSASYSPAFVSSSPEPGSSTTPMVNVKLEREVAVVSASRRKLKGQAHSLNHRDVEPKWAHQMNFNTRTGLPLNSSPAPMKKNHKSFNFDCSLTSVSAIRKSLYSQEAESASSDSDSGTSLCKSAPERMNLLGSFEESALKGRLTPFGVLDGFTIDLAASGAFYPIHVTLPVATFFYNLSEDAPLPYFGHCSLETLGRKGYHVPLKGSIQVTLFNPQGSVVKMFIVQYNLADMPPCSQTFVRQRTYFMPTNATRDDVLEHRSWLHYLIHLRFASSRSRKIYLHSDIRMLFAKKTDVDAVGVYADQRQSFDLSSPRQWGSFELRSFNEMPRNPKFSPRKMNRDDSITAEWEYNSQRTV
uniref:DUF4210 domain-containing protein n=1 Tax=Trichuris muris TaxID=70415 RepID=A0A5S6QF37_TRIMR